jgi:hypothetical protein
MIEQPCDWDGRTLCCEPGCTSPATHYRLEAADAEHAYFKRVCCLCALEQYPLVED